MSIKKVNWEKLVDDSYKDNPESKLTAVQIIQEYFEAVTRADKIIVSKLLDFI